MFHLDTNVFCKQSSTGPLTFDSLHIGRMNVITADVLLEDYRKF